MGKWTRQVEGHTVLHMGHLLEWSMLRAKQARQKVWPQGVVTGSNSSFMQRLQSVSSLLTALLNQCQLDSVV